MTFRFPLISSRPAGPRRRLPLAFFLLLLAAGAAQAQKYRTAAGLRIGKDNTGLTIQQKVLDKVTLEGLALAGPREFSGTVLVERHFGILGPSLNYYLGAGGHLGRHQDHGAIGGLDFIVGAEYKIALTPFVLSLDLKPSLELGNGDGDWGRFPSAFSVRYILLKDKREGVFRRLFGKGRKK
ncbi:hypothetical protein [uncultured Hymenobacter sp.]|uniref:hypothetical protein n=1 Tax=uncultured Hymenobacter sp. TaxID=170016 RepID=UPI0035CC9876